MKISTISIDFGRKGKLERLFLCLFTIPRPFVLLPELIEEFRYWNNGGYFPLRKYRIFYLIDHFVLWVFYCFVALCNGKAVGHSWEADVKYSTTGISVNNCLKIMYREEGDALRYTEVGE